MWFTKFLKADVPIMDDFNREKRIFTISDLREFMTDTLDNYYDMFNSSVEFENYNKNFSILFY